MRGESKKANHEDKGKQEAVQMESFEKKKDSIEYKERVFIGSSAEFYKFNLEKKEIGEKSSPDEIKNETINPLLIVNPSYENSEKIKSSINKETLSNSQSTKGIHYAHTQILSLTHTRTLSFSLL